MPLIHRWDATGGSLASYAKEHGLALWALYHWRRVLVQEDRWQPTRAPRQAKRATSRLEAVPLQFARVAVTEAPMAPYIVRLQLGNGCWMASMCSVRGIVSLRSTRGLVAERTSMIVCFPV